MGEPSPDHDPFDLPTPPAGPAQGHAGHVGARGGPDDDSWASLLDSEPDDLPDDPHDGMPSPGPWDDPHDVPPPGQPSDGLRVDDHDTDRPWRAPKPREARTPDGVATSGSLQSRILATARRMLATGHSHPPEATLRAVADVRGAADLLAALDKEDRDAIAGVCEVLDLVASGMAATSGARMDIRNTPHAAAYDQQVRDELGRVRRVALAAEGDGAHLTGVGLEWAALVEEGARTACRLGAYELLEAISRKATVTELSALHAALPRPTRAPITTTGRAEAMTAAEWDVLLDAQAQATPTRRFSCGYRTVDLALTNPAAGDPIGSFTQGTLTVIGAGSGEGKSSVAAVAVPALAADMRNQGLEQGCVILAHTEESPAVKIAQMGLRRGQRNHHLASNIVVAPVMSDRQMMMRIVYAKFGDAVRRSQETGLPPGVFAPQALFLDYVQQLKDSGEDDVKATARTADLLLNGIGNANPDEMEKYSGVSFSAVTGMRWPDELETHRVAVVTFAQLVKFDESTLRYVPGSRNTPLEKFCVMDEHGNPCWDVQPGDRRIPDKSEIRGSGVLTQHASNIIMLSRSRVEDNPVSRDAAGRSRLMDTRARWILSKTRDGASMPYLPMAFDSAPSGLKGQYYDLLAEKAISAGVFAPEESWAGAGDPILPRRQTADPFAGVRY